MSKLSDIPAEELKQDRWDAIDDICACRLAMKCGVKKLGILNPERRINQNLKQIRVIDDEIERRLK